MTWTNYALLAGANHVVYGKLLGEGAWLYIAPNGSVWKAALSGTGSALTLTLTALDGSAVSQAIAVSLSPAPSINIASRYPVILDISPTGAAAALAYTASGSQAPAVVSYDVASQLMISGVPPAAAASAALLFESGNPAYPIYTIETNTYTASLRQVRSVYYHPAPGETATELQERTIDVSTVPAPYPTWNDPPDAPFTSIAYSYNASLHTDSSYKERRKIGYVYADASLTAVEAVYQNVKVGWSTEFSQSGAVTAFAGTSTVTYKVAMGAAESAALVSVYQRSGSNNQAGTLISGPGVFATEAVRHTNKLYGLRDWSTATGESFRWSPPVSPTGPVAGADIIKATFPAASYQPVTHASSWILNGPTCFV